MSNMDDLVEDYESNGFAQPLGFGVSPALLVVDFVNAYVDKRSPMYAAVEDTIVPGAQLLAAARASRIPVIFTQVVLSAGGGANAGVFRRKISALSIYEGRTELGAIVAELAPLATEVVLEKQYASAFFGTSLSSMLAANRIDTVIIIGYSTSGCIRATAVDTVQHGYIPVVVRECVGDRDPRPHEQALFDINGKYGDVVGLEDVLAYLERLPG
jgi:nicotinamidase-related amidase